MNKPIDWSQSPKGTDGWGKRAGKAFWYQLKAMPSGITMMQPISAAPNFCPLDPLDATASFGSQPSKELIHKWEIERERLTADWEYL